MSFSNALLQRSRSRSIRARITNAASSVVESLEPRQLLTATTSTGGPLVTPSHIVVVVLEDRASGEVGDTANMPFLNQVASTGLVYSNAHGLNTPSQQGEMNYLALYSGSTQGVTDDGGSHSFSTTNLGDQLNAMIGDSFVGYAEGLPADGSQVQVASGVSHGTTFPDVYYRAYNPMAMFDAGTNAQVSKTFAEFPTDYTKLPTVSFVIPNTLDNTHGSNEQYPWAGSSDTTNNNTLKQWCDAWLSANIGPYLNWAKANNSLLIITSDEGDRARGFTSLATNNTTTIINGASSLFVGGTNTTNINQYTLLRTIEDMYGLSALGNAAGSADLDTNASGQLVGATATKAPSSTSISSSANPSTSGQSITLTAAVNVGSSAIATGNVTFIDGTTTPGTGTLNSSGVATFTTSSLSVASHSMTASYSGDSNYSSSISAVLTQVVNSATTGPANDNFANATVISGSSLTVTGTNVGATKQAGEPNIAGNAGGKSVWWTWTAPASGVVTLDTHGSTFDTLLGVYTGTSVSSLTPIASNNDDPAGGTTTSSVTFTAKSGTIYKIAVDGFNGASGSIALNLNLIIPPPAPSGISASRGTFSDSVHVAWNPLATATSYQVWRGTRNTSNKSTQIGITSFANYVDTTATPGTTYYYWVKAVNVAGTSGFSASASGYRATAASAPANDNFASGAVITGTSLSVTGSNVGATAETGEPLHAGVAGGKSIWYTWTAATSGTVTIDTHGSSFDTLLAIYTGSSVSTLTTIASNDNDTAAGVTTSTVTFSVVAGTVYHIAIDGSGGQTGKVKLNLSLV